MRRLFVCCLIVVMLAASSVAAQDVPPTLTPPATPVPDTIIEARATASALVGQMTAQEARLDERFVQADRTLSRAFDLLNLFQVIGAILGLVGVVGVFGAYQAWFNLQRTNATIRTQLEDAIRERNDELRKLARTSATASAMMELAERQYRSNDLDGAIKALEGAAVENKNNPRVHYLLGYYYEKVKRYEEAAISLDKALNIDPDYRPALAARGLVERRLARTAYHSQGIDRLERNRQYSHAAHLLHEALSDGYDKLIDEDGESWYGSLGGLYNELGSYDQAITYYERAADIVKEASYPLVNLALLMLEHQPGSRGKAEVYFREAIQIIRRKLLQTPKDRYLYSDLIVAQAAIGAERDIREAVQEYVALNGDIKDAHKRLSRLRNVMTDRAPAIQPFVDELNALQPSPDDVPAA